MLISSPCIYMHLINVINNNNILPNTYAKLKLYIWDFAEKVGESVK